MSQNKTYAFAATSLYISAVGVLALIFCLPMPYADHFTIYMLLHDYYAHGMSGVWKYATGSPEHWATSVYAILLSLALLTDWSLRAETAVMFGFLLLCGYWLVLTLRNTLPTLIERSQVWPMAVVALWILFSLNNLGNLMWGLEMLAFVALFSLFGLVYLFTLPQLTVWHFIAGLLVSLLGIYGYSPSYALLPVGLWLIATHPAPRRGPRIAFLAGWIACSVFLLVQRMQASSVALQPPSYLDYGWFVLSFLGGAATRFAEDLAIPAALLGVLLAACLSWRLYQQNRIAVHAVRAMWAYIFYAIGVGGLIAYGRLGEFGVQQALVARYMTLANPFWIGVFCIVMLFLVSQPLTLRARRSLVGFLAVISVLMVGNQVQHVTKQIRHHDRIADIKARVEANTWTREDEQTLRAAYTPPIPFADIVREMKTRHIGGF